MSKNGGLITLRKKYIFLTCVLVLLFSCLTLAAATETNDNTTISSDTTVTSDTTHAIDNVQSSNINNNYNSGLDTSESVTTNSIGEKNTSQTSSTTTTNKDTTTEKTIDTNAKTINKVGEKSVKEATEYTINTWDDFRYWILNANANSVFNFVEGRTYTITTNQRLWSASCKLRNLTINGNGAIIEGNHRRFLEIGGNLDNNIFFTLNMSNLTFNNCGGPGMHTNPMGAVIYGIHKPTVYISNCTFVNSSAEEGGAAIHIHRGNLIIENSVFINTSSPIYAAIRIATQNANLTMNNVTFIDSYSNGSGGAVYADTYGTINISNSHFINGMVNSTSESNSVGAALCINNAVGVTLENNTFINNTASNLGSVYLGNINFGSHRIVNNTFVNNTAASGAAIFVSRSYDLVIENNTFHDNIATKDGGVILIQSNSLAQINGNKFYNNSAANGGVIFSEENSAITLDSNVFYNNSAVNGSAIYTNGKVTSNDNSFNNLSATYGGAIYVSGSGADFTGINDKYNNNTAVRGGAGYVDSNAQLTSNNGIFIENNATLGGVFYIENNGKFGTNYDLCENNTAVRGGVFYINQTNRAVESEGSNYTNNKATEYGGVLYLERGSVDSEDETYLNNSALIGGAVYNLAGTVDSINNKLINNTALYGGAAFNSENGTIIKKLGTDINNNATVGGAIYNNGTLTSIDGSFENNTAVIGGAVYNGGTATAQSNSFNANNATLGGAVYNNATISTISNTFIANNATNGGALLNNGTISGNGNNYYNNTASENGGAAYICGGYSLSIQQIEFEGNVAGQNGGAIYTEENVILTSSHDVKYTNNSAVRGGAVYLNDSSTLTTSADKFVVNNATEGGAIYAASNSNVIIKTKTTFDSNNATLGGAIYINDSAVLNSNDAVYKNGHATNGSAIFAQQGSQLIANGNQFILNDAENGAVYIEEGVTTSFSNGKYTDNTAENGAAIYTKSDLNTNGLNFTSNNATLGGAIYLDGVNYNSNQDTFTSNNATHGGAIYVDEDSTANISSSAFSTNKATDGGAIYLDGDAVLNTTGTTYRHNDAINGGVIYVSQDANVNALGGDSYTANTATNGGVLYNKGNVNSTDNTYSGNIAQTGGVLYNAPDANFTADNDAFTSNNAVDGAVLVNYGNVTITHSTIDSNTGTNSVILNNKVLTLTDNTVSKNIVTADDGYVILNNVDTATIVNNLFDSNTDFKRDMLLGSVQPQSITGNTYIDNFLNDTMEVPGVIEIPIDVLEYFINITVNLNNIYNDTVRNGTVYFYDELLRIVGEGVVVDGNASVRIYRPVITKSITNVTVVYTSLSKHYQDISLKSELHLGKTTQIVIVPINQTYVDEKINVTVYLYETDNLQLMYDANITVNINGTEYTGNTTDKGYIVIEDISFNRYGNYPMNATFEGNKTHSESTVNGTIEIIKIPTFLNMTLPSDVHHPDDEGYINVTLHDARDNSTLRVFNITLNITGEEGYVALPDESGKITYLFQAHDNGHINVVASVHESSDKYAIPAEVHGEFFIERYHTHFHSNTSAIIPATETNVTFTLYDTDHNLLKNKNITITIIENGVPQTPQNVTTDDSGQYTLSYTLHPTDDVIITAYCIEDYKYRNSSLPVHLMADKNSTWVAVSPENTFINKTTTIRINLQENGNMPLTGTVNLTVGEYGPVEVEVTDGEIVYTTPWTWPERQYVDVYVSYLGDEFHTDTSATSTFTVFRAATVTSIGLTDNLDTKTVIVGNVTSEGYPPINIGNVTLTAEYTNFTTGLRETIDLGNVTVIDGKFNLTTDKLMVLEEDYGRYVITATYNTNNVFYESSADTGTVRITSVRNTTISIVANPRTVVGTEESILFYLYDSKGEALSNKTLIITINGTEYVGSEFTTNNEGFVQIYTIFDEVGLNNITARFAGDDYYNSSDNNETITVKQKTILVLTVPPTVHVYDNVTINVTLKDIDGNPLVGESVILNDHEHQGTFITDENGTISADGFYSTCGTKNITAEYRGSLFYINSLTNDIIQALRLDTTLNVTSESPVLIGNVTKLEGYLSLHNGTPLANKKVLMYINDVTDGISLKTDENGYYCYNYTTDFSGRNTVKVVFETDDTYWGFTDTQTFIVKKYITDVSVEADRLIKVGDSTTITGILEDEFGNRIPNKVINLTVNGQVVAHDTTDNDGSYQFIFTQPESGIYNITVNFTGDDKYLKSFDTYQIKVDKIITHLNITGTSPVNYGDKITVEAVLFDEYGNVLSRENITVYINQSEIANITTRGFGDAEYSYIADTIGLQNITFNYNGTAKYYGSNNTYQVNVLKLYTHFDNLEATNVEIGSNSTISGYLIDESGRGLKNTEFNVTLNDNETTTKTITTDNTGFFTFQYNSTKIGINNVTVSYAGNYSQEPVDDYITFNVDGLDVFIDINVTNVKAGNTTMLVNVTDEDGNPIPEGTVIVYYNEGGEQIGNGTVGENGTVEISIPLEPGIQDLLIVYNGTEELYKYANKIVTINVPGYVLNITINDINDTKVRNSTNITGFLFYEDVEQNPIVGENVTIFVDGVEIANVTTGENGNYSYVYNATTSGFKEVLVVFLGNETHSRVEATSNFTVEKINTTVSIESIENTTVDYKVVINGTLVDEFDIIVPNAIVTIEINGVNYTNTTDENGKYFYEYTTSVVGLNNITVYYDGNNTFNATVSNTTFNVTAHPTNVTANITNPRPENNLITITVTDENKNNVTTGNVIIKEDENELGSGIIVNGELVTTITLNPGEHTLNIEYEGITKYSRNSTTYTVIIPKYNTTIIPDVINAVKINDTIYVNGTLVDQFNRPVGPTSINISINGINVTVPVDDEGRFSYENTTNVTGVNNVTITYVGDDTYVNSSASLNFTVSPLFTQITVNATSPVIITNDTVISGVLKDEYGNVIVDAQVEIWINGELNETVTNGENGYSHTVKTDTLGLNNVTVIYRGDSNHTAVNASTNYYVDKMFTAVNITTVSPIKVGSNTTITGRLVDGLGSPIGEAVINITVGDNDKYNTTTDGDGYYTLNVTGTTVGEYKVKVFYNGSEVFMGSNNTAKYIVELYSSYVVANNSDVVNGVTNVTVNVTDDYGNPISGGFVNITDENGNFLANGTIDENGNLTTNITLPPGKHTITIAYNGTENSTKANATLIIDVPKYLINLTLEDVNNTIVRNSTNITGTLECTNGTKLDGVNVTIYVNNKFVANATVNDGVYFYEYYADTTVLNDVKVVYEGNDTYVSAEQADTFEARQLTANATITQIDNITVGNITNINGTVIDEFGVVVADAEIIVSVNGRNYTTTTNSTGGYNLTYTANIVGENNITVIFEGNNTIAAFTNTSTFNVTKIKTTTVAELITAASGTSLIGINVTDEFGLNVTDGPITIKLGEDIVATGQVLNGYAVVAVPTEAGREYVFTVSYDGTDIYVNSTATTTSSSIPKYNTTIIPDVINAVKINDTIYVNGTLVDQFNRPVGPASINISINGINVTVPVDAQGKFTYENTTNVTGINNVSIVYDGDDTYANSSVSLNFTVSPLFTQITVNATSPVIITNDTTISGVLKDEYGNVIVDANVEIWINGELNETVVNGADGYTHTVKTDRLGINNVTVVYRGDSNHTAVNATTNYYVDKMFTAINVTATSPIKVDSNTTISGRLVDGLGNPIGDAVVNITVGDNDKYNATTSPDGYYTLNVTGTTVGEYKVRVFYNGTEIFIESNNTGKFIVEKHDIDMNVEVEELKAGNTTLNITITDENGDPVPDGFVNVTNADGEVIGNGTIVNGELITNITVEPGKQDIIVIYNGTEDYETFNKTIRLDVPKYQTELTVDVPEDTEVRASTFINGTVLDQEGKGIKDANISIYVNGEKFTVYADDDGKYSLKYNATTSGTKNVIVEYKDETGIHSEEFKTTEFMVSPINTTITIEDVDDATVGDIININGTLADYKDRIIPFEEVIISINGINRTVGTDENGAFSLNYTATIAGQNNVTVYYHDDRNNFNDNESKMIFNVAKEPTEVVAEIVLPRDGTSLVEVNVTDSKGNRVTDGVVEIKDGDTVIATGNIINGTVVIPVATEAGQICNYGVVYKGTNIYENSTTQIKDTLIPKRNITIIPDPIGPVEVGTTINITGKIVDEYYNPLNNTEINITVNGVNYTIKTDENGTYSYPYTPNTSGINNVTVTVDSSEKYESGSSTYHFKGDKIPTQTTITTPSTVKAGRETTIDGLLTDDDNNPIPYAKITVTVGETPINTETDKNGLYSVTTTPTAMGINSVTVSYDGNDTYKATSNTGVILVDKLDTIVTVNASNSVKVEKVNNITGTLVDEFDKAIGNANITVTVNGEQIKTTTNDKGAYVVNYSTTTAGVNNVTVSYSGDDEHYPITGTKKFTVEKLDVVVDVAMSVENATSCNLVANVTDENGNKVTNGTVTITTSDGQQINATVKDGVVNVTVPTSPGEQTFKVTYNGNDDCSPTTVSFTEDVPKVNTTISVNKLNTAKVDDSTTVTGTLKDSYGTPIPNAQVTVKYGDTTKVVTTDSKGRYTATISDIRSGTNNVTVTYSGNDTYNSISINTTQVVNKYATKVTVDKVIGIIGEKITLTAYVTDINGNKISGGNLVFKLNGKTLKEDYRFDSDAAPLKFKVVDGKVNITLTADLYLRNAKNLTASYSGSYKYEANSSKVVIAQIQKRKAAVKVTTVPTTVKQDSYIFFKAYLTDVTRNSKNKTALSTDGTVIFKLNGNTIKDETGSQVHVEVVNDVATYKYYIKPGTASVDKNGTLRNYSVEAVYDNPSYYPSARNSTVFNVEKSDVTINFVKTTVKSNKLSVKATLTDYKGNYLVGTNQICIKINGRTYQENNKTKIFEISGGKIDLTGIKLASGTKVKSVTIVTGERQPYHAARETTTDITVS